MGMNLKKAFAICMSMVFLAAGIVNIPVTTVLADSGTFYVDNVDGNDENDGTSPSNAWKSLDKANSITLQPGESLLFKAGGTWTGQLSPKGSGTEGNPVKIGMYGEGERPLLAGEGVSETVYFYNQEYIEISDLEITNWTSEDGVRSGVKFEAKDAGTLNNIVVRNLSVHDIKTHYISADGSIAKNMIGNGGIIFKIRGNTVKTKWNNVLVEGCTLYNIEHYGINLNSSYTKRDGVTGAFALETGIPDSECSDFYPSTNIIIRGNTLYHIGNGMITPNVCDGVLIEGNKCDDGNAYYASNVPIWWTVTDNVIAQYNEVSNTKNPANGDACAFDADLSTYNALIQYNYTHDNANGFFLWCSWDGLSPAKNVTIRYNISQNDGGQLFWFSNAKNAGSSGHKIYNNTFYMSGDTEVISSWSAPISDPTWVEFKNNIFYSTGSGGWPTDGTAYTVDNNAYYGASVINTADANRVTLNPMLSSPGSGGSGIDTLDGYKLESSSPCIGAGAVISDNGGEDFWGDPVSESGLPNIGAYNGSGVESGDIAKGKTATASSYEDSTRMPDNGIDGDLSTMWIADSGEAGQWWMVDLGTTYNVTESELTFETSGEVWKYKIEGSIDGTNFNELYDLTADGSSDTIQNHSYNSVARYLRITFSAAPGTKWTAFKEFKVYGTPKTVTYLIKNRWTGWNIKASDTSDAAICSDEDTGLYAQWERETVDGYVLYKNIMTGEYLNIQNLTGNVEASVVPNAYWSAQWEEAATDEYVRLVNRWNSLPAHIENGSGYVQYGTIESTAWSSHWSIIAVD